jgi:hypothetical protein
MEATMRDTNKVERVFLSLAGLSFAALVASVAALVLA